LTALLSRLFLLACLLASPAALAQTYPDRNVTIVVTSAAGALTDTLTRAVAQRLSEMWKQSVIVENRSGAGYSIAAQSVMRAEHVSAQGLGQMGRGHQGGEREDRISAAVPVQTVALALCGCAILWSAFGAGESLYALSKRHDISRQLIRVWVQKYEAGALDEDAQAADLLQEYEAKIAALERMVGRQALEIEFLKGALKNAPRPRSVNTSVIAGLAASPSQKDAG
jgi:transposase